MSVDINPHATVDQVRAALLAAPDTADAIDDAIRAFRPPVVSLCATEAGRVGLIWSDIGDDIISVGLSEIHAFLGRLLAGFQPDNPHVEAFTIAQPSIRWKVRSWIDGHRGWADPFSGTLRAWNRHRTAMSLAGAYTATTGAAVADDPDQFLDWAARRTKTRIRIDDLTAPVPPRLGIGDDDAQDWADDATARIGVKRAAATVIAWGDNQSGACSLATRHLLTGYTTGDVYPLPTWGDLKHALPALSARECQAMRALIAERFRAQLGHDLG